MIVSSTDATICLVVIATIWLLFANVVHNRFTFNRSSNIRFHTGGSVASG